MTLRFLARLKPWWFCCGRRSYWCVADTVLHWLFRTGDNSPESRWARWVCDRHDRWITWARADEVSA